MSRRVLIVSPYFSPIYTADSQRVRMSLPHFREFGWMPYILSVQPDYVEGIYEPLLDEMIPPEIRIIRTRAIPIKHTKNIGFGNLGVRCLPYLRRSGNQILAREKIDLVYFSTTVFPVMALGPYWHRRFGVPYVLDFQDPWRNDYYDRAGAPMPPGGRFKYSCSQAVARVLEPYSLRKVSHAITVSPAYPQALLQRYPWLREDQFTVLPFGASQEDFEVLRSMNVQQKIFNARDNKQHWVYVGAAGPMMTFALRSFFHALRRAREKEALKFNNLMLHFIGTDYNLRGSARNTIELIAAEYGVEDIVQDHPQRIP